jgi:SAM-dependent methyltransferase
MASIHTSPGAGKFGEDPDQYDLARPPYPAALFDWLKQRCNLGVESDCFEIGAGTGHATLPILSMPVRSLSAIEPDERLASRLQAKARDFPNLSVILQRFEETEFPTGAFDFGFAAMSFHWLARMKALKRVCDALKPGGSFAMWWNIYHDPARPDTFQLLTEHLFGGLEQDPATTRQRPAFGLDTASRLGEMGRAGLVRLEHRLFPQEVTFTASDMSALYTTFSRVRMAPDDIRSRLLSEVERTVREAFGGEVRRTIWCSAYVGRKG